MNIEKLEILITQNLINRNNEIKRVFHGRGNFYEDYNYLTLDCLGDVLLATFFEQTTEEENIINLLKNIAIKENFETFIVQRRYKSSDFNEAIIGEINPTYVVFENALKYQINFFNKNIGIFLDMKTGREYLSSICKDKSVLNLFSYTCSFSVVAINSGATKVVNVDMAKNALTTGRTNHHLNNLDTKKVEFMPYNILKSFSRIRKYAPYDIVIIDPPSFQKGSFSASSDYEKIIRKLDELTNNESIVMAALNDPMLDSAFLIEKFKEFAPNFIFDRILDNLQEFKAIDEEKSLKILIFYKKI